MYRTLTMMSLLFAAPALGQPFTERYYPVFPEPILLPEPPNEPAFSTSRLPRRAPPVDPVLQWNEAALEAIKKEHTPPPVAARNLAVLHVAIYDAVNSVRKTHRSFRSRLSPPATTSIETAVAVAGYQILAALYPKQLTRLNALLDESLLSIPDGIAKTDGITLGRKVAANTLAWRQDDLLPKKSAYASRSEVGHWQPTPPDFKSPLLPGWASLPPFGVRSTVDFRPPAQPELSSEEFVRAFWEVKSIGGSKSKVRTKEQEEIARFWADGAGTVTPPGHWNRIARTLAEDRRTTSAENARLFAMLNVALADAGIVCWDAKFAFDFWRPIAAIRRADNMNNPILASDTQWNPLLPTPPFPAYPSGHSTFSAAAAASLTNFFGTDAMRFSTTSDDLPGVTRSFASLGAAAQEAGMSRIYGGIHWQFDNREGLVSGRKIGNETSKLFGGVTPQVEESSSLRSR